MRKLRNRAAKHNRNERETQALIARELDIEALDYMSDFESFDVTSILKIERNEYV